MVLKKPYAFLIKHFRLIHLILALPLIYIVRKTHLIVNYFNLYVKNSYNFQTGSDISGLYVNAFMLFSIFIIIVAILSIYYLLKYKEKPVKWYVVMIIYYIVLFIMLFWYSGIIASMSKTVLSAKMARVYRDVSIIIYLPQYIFVIFTVLRAVGFNLKQFNFQSDLKELEIKSEDNEEVEVGFELDGYKTKRFFRRFKREFSYYLIENKLMVSAVLIILMFSSIIVYYNTRKNYDVSYQQRNSFVHQGFQINVKDSIITNLDYQGNKISDKYYYLVLKTNITNNMSEKEKLNYDNFVINVNGKNLTPTLDLSTHFIDYGAPYLGEKIKPNFAKDYVLVYQIKKSDIKKSYKLKVLSSFQLKSNDLVTKYAVVNLTPVNVSKVNVIQTLKLKDKISFSGTNIGNTLITINDFYKGNSYTYDYEYCYSENNCTTKKNVVSLDYTKAKTTPSLLVLDYDYDLDTESSYGSQIKDKNMLFENFVTVKTNMYNEEEEYTVINVTPKNLKNKVVLQVNGNINNASKLDLCFTIRNKRYVVNLI